MATPEFKTGLASQQNTLLKANAAHRHKGDYICRANARMLSLLTGQINQFACAASATKRRLKNSVGLSCDGDNRSVLSGIEGQVQQMDSLDPHGRHNLVDTTRVNTFAEVGYARNDR